MQTASLFLGASIASGCFAQAAFVNVYWEANDGVSGWTRGSLATTQSNVQVRLAIEWDAPASLAFGSIAFDGVISNTAASDAVTNIARIDPWQYVGETLVATHQGSTIKLDNATDTALPGQGSSWVFAAQAAPDITTIGMDFSHTVFPLSFNLGLATGAYGTRSISMAPFHYRTGQTSLLWMQDYSGLRVDATIQGVDVTYVPTPTAMTALSLAGLASIRRKRS